MDVHERMDYELFAQIERQKISEETRKSEFSRQLNDAHQMWSRATAELQTVNAALVQSPNDSHAYALVANARAVEKATLRYLHQLHHERKLRFAL